MKNIKPKKWDLVELRWRDAIRQQTAWREEAEFDYKGADKFADGMRAVGYVTKVTDDHIYITQQWSMVDGAVSNVLSIPLKGIIKTKILRKLR